VKKGELTMMKRRKNPVIRYAIFCLLGIIMAACASSDMYYVDPNMDFGAVRTVAIMPFENLTAEKTAAERVRDTFTNILLSSGQIYALPPGEVARAAIRAGITDPITPAVEGIIKLAAITKVNAVITGVVREYGEVRSGGATANVVSFSLQMIEAQSGRIVWSASSTKGGISAKDRLFGGGGKPMNDVTEEAVNDILNKFFR
jgi:hypothetical protein